VFRLLLQSTKRSEGVSHVCLCIVALSDGKEALADPQTNHSAKAGPGMRNKAEGIVQSRLLDVDSLAAYVGLSPHTIYTMVSQRRIPYVKVGRLVRFDLGLLDGWLKQHTVMPMPPRKP
jgi:excisionase family DNA binding protein